jgi:hypothetical protein
VTVRDRIKGIQVELRDTDVSPMRSREMLVELTALLGNCMDEMRQADAEFSHQLAAYLETETKANRARILAETTPAYHRKRTAHDTRELVVEMIRSLKVVLRSTEEEMRLAR